jgi:hypothetical protein
LEKIFWNLKSQKKAANLFAIFKTSKKMHNGIVEASFKETSEIEVSTLIKDVFNYFTLIGAHFM